MLMIKEYIENQDVEKDDDFQIATSQVSFS
jgi:hypothetical protein